MKKILLGLLVIGSASANAQIDSRTFLNPSLNGISFSSHSNPTVVCNYLGYANAASTYLESRLTDAVIVNDKGIIGSDYGTMDSLVSIFSKVTCTNALNSNDSELNIPTLIKNPSHPSLEMVFSRTSSENGVCKLLGFTRAAGGTLGRVIYPTTGIPVVDEEGRLIGEEHDSASTIRKIICL